MYHPDKPGGSTSKFQALSAVHAILADPTKRKHYDATGISLTHSLALSPTLSLSLSLTQNTHTQTHTHTIYLLIHLHVVYSLKVMSMILKKYPKNLNFGIITIVHYFQR